MESTAELNGTLGIAQIGVGYWGPNLLRNLVANKNCKVRKVIDITPARLKYVEQNYPDIKRSANVDDIFDDPEIQAVVITTPAATHFQLAIRALKAGKHVLVEKPMATTVDEIQQIKLLANEKNLIAMAGHTFLYNSAVIFLKELIKSGELGDIRYIYSQRLNLGRIRSDVDALWNFAPHDISIIQFLLDDVRPVSVQKQGMDYVQNGIDDVVFMNLVYPDKIMAHIHVSWLDPHKIRRMTIVGTKKMVVYDDGADNKITIYDKGIDLMAELGKNMDFDNPALVRFNYRSEDILLPKVNFVEPLKAEVNHFFDCILNGTKCRSDAEHAQKVVEILCEADSV